MDETRADLLMRVEGMTCDGCAAAVTRTVKRVDPAAFFDPKIAFLTGPANAKKTLVEFYDYNCPYCRQSLPAVMKYIASHPDTRVSFIEFPIKGEASNIAARAALASRLQPERFLPFHYILMSEKDLVDEQIIYADAVKAGLNLAKLKADMQRPEIAKAVSFAPMNVAS